MNNPHKTHDIAGDAIGNPERREAKNEHLSDALDEALGETFPASDPVAVNVTRIAEVPSKNESSYRLAPAENTR